MIQTGKALSRAVMTLALAAGLAASAFGDASARSAAEIRADVERAKQEMFSRFPVTRKYYQNAVAVLIVPEIIKGGFILAGARGKGHMSVGGRIDSYWSYTAGSIGFQAGLQETNQALFFMTADALDRFLDNEGVEFGLDAEVTVIDDGAEAAVDTTKDTKPVIVVVFGRGGLLAGASLQGGKYSRITP